MEIRLLFKLNTIGSLKHIKTKRALIIIVNLGISNAIVLVPEQDILSLGWLLRYEFVFANLLLNVGDLCWCLPSFSLEKCFQSLKRPPTRLAGSFSLYEMHLLSIIKFLFWNICVGLFVEQLEQECFRSFCLLSWKIYLSNHYLIISLCFKPSKFNKYIT